MNKTSENGNSPLEGCRLADGVDALDWKSKSLFPYWNLPKNKGLIQKAKSLRKAGVISEVIFWTKMKDKSIIGFDIHRQVIIGNYIVDFFIPELGFIIEIDGVSHQDKIDYDTKRDSYFWQLDLFILHLTDLDVKTQMDKVYNYVMSNISERVEYLRKHPPRR